MKQFFYNLQKNIIPCIILGIVLVLLISLSILFFYLLMWGIIVGSIIWLIAVVKTALFPAKTTAKSSGRIIEHDDKN